MASTSWINGLYCDCFGVSVHTARKWRAIVASVIESNRPRLADFEDGTTEQPGETSRGIYVTGRVPPKAALVAVVERIACERLSFVDPSREYVLPENTITRGKVDCSGVNRRGWIGEYAPRRIRGHDGSPMTGRRSVDWMELQSVIGGNAVAVVLMASVSDYRRLDILSGVFCHERRLLSAVLDAERVERMNVVGFAGCSDSTITHGKAMASHDASLLARIIASAESRDVERERLAALAGAMADAVRSGLSLALKSGLTQPETAKMLGITDRTLRNDLAKVRAAVSGF